jgi:hypothetical protein
MLEGRYIDARGKDGFHNSISGQMWKTKGRPSTVPQLLPNKIHAYTDSSTNYSTAICANCGKQVVY